MNAASATWCAALVAAALFAGTAIAAADGGDTRFVDFLYMEPNEGGSSAGHVALALGDRTFAYQRDAAGRLALERDDSEHVRWLYAVLGNRAVQRLRVALPAATFDRLRDGLNRRYLIQQRQLALLDGVGADRRLLAILGEPPSEDDTGVSPIPAAGYFAAGDTAARSPALLALHDRVVGAYGTAALAARAATLRSRLADLRPNEDDLPPPTIGADDYPAGGSFAARHTAAASAVVALAILHAAPALDPDGVRTVDDAPLAELERQRLGDYADILSEALVALAASARSDFGFPLLVGMARLAAIERSLGENRLVVLDAFPDDGRRLAPGTLARTADAAYGLRDDARADLAASRAAFATATRLAERDYVALETAANRFLELDGGIAEGRAVRLATGPLVPTRRAASRLGVVPALSDRELAAARDRTAGAAVAYERRLDDLYAYDLVRRNCVTETFRTIDAVLGPDAAALGEHVAAESHFIPAAAAYAVARRWRIAARDTTPSYRTTRMAALAAGEHPLVVRLRESNTLTSTIYRPSRDDSTFLFFTDDAALLRPVLGATNLAVGVGAGLVGAARAPFDGGEALRAGLFGVLWSLPELAFVNVRKGSFDHVARRDLPDGPAWSESPRPSRQ